MGETYLCIILVLADYKGLERSVYRSNPLAGLLILENKYSRLAFQIVVRVLSGRVHHINIDFSPGLFECEYGILLCPPIARTDKVELWTEHQSSISFRF